jgi:S-DNA-T family DNA segregation ATPase FtsK/SpoIIIE
MTTISQNTNTGRTFLGRPVDHSLPHTPGWAAFNATSSTAVAGTGAFLAHMPPVYGLGLGAVAAATGIVSGRRKRINVGHHLFRAACLLGAGAWVAWSAAHDPWSSWAPGAALAGAGIVGWGSGVAVEETETGADDRQGAAAAQRRRNGIGDDWEERLLRVTGLACKVVAVQDWPGKVGMTLDCELPSGGRGNTVTEVKRYEEALSTDARLPHGAGVEVGRGIDRGAFLLRVALRDVMADLIPLPDDISPLSINGEFDIGLHRDATQAMVGLRYQCGLLTGNTDAGKTNQLNVVNDRLARCTDVLIWHIDTTGAGISLPWLRAWALDGTAARPVVDYVAPTVAEAVTMLHTAEQIIAARKLGYQDLMHSVNDDKVPVSAKIPEILIVVDEVKELPPSVQAQIDTVINTGRASGVRVLVCALRAVADTITSAMKVQAKLRIGMRSSDPEEYTYLFPGWQRFDPNDAPYQGCGFISPDGSTPRVFKGYRITPADIATRSVQLSDRRPSLDELSAGVEAGGLYRARWARTLPVLYRGAPLSEAAQVAMGVRPDARSAGAHDALMGLSGHPGTPGPDVVVDRSGADAPPPGGWRTPLPSDSPEWERLAPPEPPADPADTEAWDAWEREIAEWKADGEPVGADPDPRVISGVQDDVDRIVLSPEGVTAAPAAAPEAGPEAQSRVWELLDEAGQAGIGPGDLAKALQAEGYSTVRTTVQGWLTLWASSGLIVRRTEGVRYPVYVHGKHAPDKHI